MKSKSVNKNNIQWDITDVYKSDNTLGDPNSQYFLHIVTHVNEGESVKIKQIQPSDVSHGLQNEFDQIDGYDGTELIFIVTASFNGLEGNVRDIRTSYHKEKILGEGFFGMLVLEDSNLNGRPRKVKRTSNAVTSIKPGHGVPVKPLSGKLKIH